MEKAVMMKMLKHLADIEDASEAYLNHGEYTALSQCLNDPEYDDLWKLRFPVSDKLEVWQLLQYDKKEQETRLRPYSQVGVRCGRSGPADNAPLVAVVYACSGSIECTIEDEHFTIHEDELCIVNSGTIANLSSTRSDGFFIWFFFNKLFLNNSLVSRFPANSRFAQFFEQALYSAPHGLDFLVFNLEKSAYAREYCLAAVEAFLFRPNGHDEIEGSLLFLLFMELENLWATQREPRKSKNTAITAYDIVNFINANYRDVTLTSISEHFHFHPDTMRKMIKTVMNKNFIDVVQDIRLTAACEQLRKTNLPITDIIQACGYQNASHFYTLFRERYHCSPAKYRADKSGAG